jgi:hypothetical protein
MVVKKKIKINGMIDVGREIMSSLVCRGNGF